MRSGVWRFSIIGHDWGTRAAYAIAALAPEKLDSLTAISVAYSSRGAFPVPPFEQSRAWWYQFFMPVDRGAQTVAADPIGFVRIQWETWSPSVWFDDAPLSGWPQSFANPDCLAITLSSFVVGIEEKSLQVHCLQVHKRRGSLDPNALHPMG
jgi:pimeloyl-ACP methyl ester carboxylesterase